MRAKIPHGMILSVLAGLGFAFWAGRASVPENTVGLTASGRTDARAAARNPARKTEPGGGGQAVTSAQQLRALFMNSGGNWQTGRAVADAALGKMNGPQLSQLVHNLATAQATTPGYSYSREINAACVRWAEVDPDAALQFALSNKQASFRAAAIGGIIAGIAKTDPALARAGPRETRRHRRPGAPPVRPSERVVRAGRGQSGRLGRHDQSRSGVGPAVWWFRVVCRGVGDG